MILFNQNTIIALLAFGASHATASSNDARSLESEPFRCDEALDCLDCVENGCGWGAGECMDSCDMIPDTSCYDMWTSPGMTAREICRMDWTDKRDEEICGAQGSDCNTCTSTSLSNPSDGNCYWYPQSGTCRPMASDWHEQGTNVCSHRHKCEMEGSSCNSCLQAGCKWAGDQCVATCDDVADAACYSQQTFPQLEIRNICRLAALDETDHNICSYQTDCGSCTSTLQFDGHNHCKWYTDSMSGQSWCGTGECDMNGNCGEDTCAFPSLRTVAPYYQPSKAASTSTATALASSSNNLPSSPATPSTAKAVAAAAAAKLSSEAEPVTVPPQAQTFSASSSSSSSCEAMTTCTECLDSDCAWAIGSCHDSCDVIADAACWTEASTTTASSSNAAICQAVEIAAANDATCQHAGATCGDCTSTLMSDGTPCSWFTDPEDSTQGWCAMGGCDMMGNCGATTCDARTSALPNSNSNSNSKKAGTVRGAAAQNESEAPSSNSSSSSNPKHKDHGFKSFFKALVEP